ncbi:MAG: KamA family radical SAM protein [Candidatus Omnitrophica bacterium]|nr:KamA family radical SAM protein [Candidatus Omnitrophota bacterium]MCB9720313.1 KamA family radical SAM protein [Candidatus Omnitrophota bacterium]
MIHNFRRAADQCGPSSQAANDEAGTLQETDEPPDHGPTTADPLISSLTFIRPQRKDAQRTSVHDFPVSSQSLDFITRFYPDCTLEEWNDWKWQVRNRIRDVRMLERVIPLTGTERRAVLRRTANLPIAITPYYLSLISRTDPHQPLRKTHIPWEEEFSRTPGEDPDPLGEEHHMAVPGIVHRYPDRVLFLTTGFCSTYCRYCTRSRMVGETNGEYSFSVSQWELAIRYIEQHPEIRDCLLSGGDPLSIGDRKLAWLLGRLRAIPHLEFIRIGTKIPVVMPQRITPELCETLKQFHPLWMSIHFTHPDELTPETVEACARLANAGIPLGSQTVLLKGVNDNADTLRDLFHGLLKARVKPYYLYQCDPVSGSAHFRTPVERGLEIIRQLRGHTTGYAIPQFVIDAPGGGGKIPLLPDYVVGRDGDDLLLTNFEDKTYRYPDPGGRVGRAQNALRAAGARLDPESGVYLI